MALTLALALMALGASSPRNSIVSVGRLWHHLIYFNTVCIIGSLLNTEYVHFLPAFAQLLMWNEPILLFLAIMRLPFSSDDINKFKRLLFFLIGLELVIGFVQVPLALSRAESEIIIGTFAGNAEQYQQFILLGLFCLVAGLKWNHGTKVRRFAAILLILILVVLIDNKASWISLASHIGNFCTQNNGPSASIFCWI
jgi:hypothetical protein